MQLGRQKKVGDLLESFQTSKNKSKKSKSLNYEAGGRQKVVDYGDLLKSFQKSKVKNQKSKVKNQFKL